MSPAAYTGPALPYPGSQPGTPTQQGAPQQYFAHPSQPGTPTQYAQFAGQQGYGGQQEQAAYSGQQAAYAGQQQQQQAYGSGQDPYGGYAFAR